MSGCVALGYDALNCLNFLSVEFNFRKIKIKYRITLGISNIRGLRMTSFGSGGFNNP